jgi:excisionase family DNA binding protein
MANFIMFSEIEFEQFKQKIVSELVANFNAAIKENQSKEIKYLTRKETAKLLGVSLVTLNHWAKDDILKAYKIGTRVRYKSDEVEQFFKPINN